MAKCAETTEQSTVTKCAAQASAFQDTLEVRRYVPDLTAIQKSRDGAGMNYPVSATEGSLYPFDDSSMSGWCGEDSAGVDTV